jgi:hypothetical protein
MLAGGAGFDEWIFAWVVGYTDSERAKSLDLSQHGYAGDGPREGEEGACGGREIAL